MISKKTPSSVRDCFAGCERWSILERIVALKGIVGWIIIQWVGGNIYIIKIIIIKESQKQLLGWDGGGVS